MDNKPEFTQAMKDKGAVYLGRGMPGSNGPKFMGWTMKVCGYWSSRDLWHGSSPNLHYALDPADENFELVCREFGVPTGRTGDPWYSAMYGEMRKLADLTAIAPIEDHVPWNTLPSDSAERKNYPLYRGLMRYFPAALAGVAKHSKEGNDKHNPGEPMHHARGKSNDHADCILRHLTDLSDLEAEFQRACRADVCMGVAEAILTEADALAWRANALSQELHEKYGGAPMAPGARE